MRSNSFADSSAKYCSSGSGSSPRRFSARQASRIVSLSYCCTSVSGRLPFSPGFAPAETTERSRWSNAAWGLLRMMYGHISSTSGPIARPFSCHSQAGLAFAAFGRVGPKTFPPASSTQRKTSKLSVVDMEIVACQVGRPRTTDFPIMYDPSPSRRPARYAASTSFIRSSYAAPTAKPSYWRTAVTNLRTLDAQMDAPALFGEATAC